MTERWPFLARPHGCSLKGRTEMAPKQNLICSTERGKKISLEKVSDHLLNPVYNLYLVQVTHLWAQQPPWVFRWSPAMNCV